jgi:hypothetical protein
MDFDPTQFFQASAANAPLVLLVVVGLTAVAGDFGLAGKWKKLFALVTGALFGGGLMVASGGAPVGFAGWFSAIIYGLLIGLAATKLYETGEALLQKTWKP